MAVTAAGSMALGLVALENTLAASAAFQARTGAADATEAARSIYRDIVTDDDGVEYRRPLAVVKSAARGANQVAEGVAVDLLAGGGFLLVLEDNAQHPADHQESYLDFLSWCGQVIDQIEQIAGVDDYLPAARTELVMAPERTPRPERAADGSWDFWRVAFLIDYGDRE